MSTSRVCHYMNPYKLSNLYINFMIY